MHSNINWCVCVRERENKLYLRKSSVLIEAISAYSEFGIVGQKRSIKNTEKNLSADDNTRGGNNYFLET